MAAETGAALILMHTRGRSREMYDLADYDDVVTEVGAGADSWRSTARTSAGVAREAIILDPGFGFAKRAGAQLFTARAPRGAGGRSDRPILSGPSRKSFLKEALGERLPADREWGTAAAVTASVLFGAHIVRVHNVARHDRRRPGSGSSVELPVSAPGSRPWTG